MSEEKMIHEAAEAYYCARSLVVFHDQVHGPLVKECAILDAFKDGAIWQSEYGSAVRSVPRMPTPHDDLMGAIGRADKDRERNYANMMAILEAINKAVVDLAKSEAGRHNALTGGLVETQAMVQDAGQKVEAVLDQVTPPDWNGRTEETATEKLHAAMKSVGIDNPERFTVGVDIAKPGTDRNGYAFRDQGGRIYHVMDEPAYGREALPSPYPEAYLKDHLPFTPGEALPAYAAIDGTLYTTKKAAEERSLEVIARTVRGKDEDPATDEAEGEMDYLRRSLREATDRHRILRDRLIEMFVFGR